MLALITLAAWQVAALSAFITALIVLWLHARHWSVKRLVMVSVHYKDGANKKFVTFPCCLEALYKTIAGNPRILKNCNAYSPEMDINPSVIEINLFRFSRFGWHHNRGLENNLEFVQTLWDRRHALLVNVLEDFGLDDSQPMDPKVLNLLSHQRLNVENMTLALGSSSRGAYLAASEVAYLERLGECLRIVDIKKWTREHRYERFNGKLPGTDELVMELLATDEGAKKVLACISRDWQPEPIPAPPEPPVSPKHAGAKC